MGRCVRGADVTAALGENVDRVLGARRAVGQAMQQNLRFAARIRGELEIAGVGKWADSALVRLGPCDSLLFPCRATRARCVRREFLR